MIADLRATALGAWADGMLPFEAAVDLLTHAVGGCQVAVAPRMSEEQFERDCEDNE